MKRVFAVMIILCIAFTTNLGNMVLVEDNDVEILSGNLMLATDDFNMYLDEGTASLVAHLNYDGRWNLTFTLLRDGVKIETVSHLTRENFVASYVFDQPVYTGETSEFQVKIKYDKPICSTASCTTTPVTIMSNKITIDDVPPSDPKVVEEEVTDVKTSSVFLKWKYSPYWYENNLYDFTIVNDECTIPEGTLDLSQ